MEKEKIKIMCSVVHKNSCGDLIRDEKGNVVICCGDDLGGDNNEFAQCCRCRIEDFIDYIILLKKNKNE